MAYFEPPWRKRRRMRETVPSHEQPWTATSPGLPTEDEVARKYLDYYAETGSDPLYDKSAGANNLPMAARYATLGRSSLPASYLPAEEEKRGASPELSAALRAGTTEVAERAERGIRDYGKTVEAVGEVREVYPWMTEAEAIQHLKDMKQLAAQEEAAIEAVAKPLAEEALPEGGMNRAERQLARAAATTPEARRWVYDPNVAFESQARYIEMIEGKEAAQQFRERVLRRVQTMKMLAWEPEVEPFAEKVGRVARRAGALLKKLPSPEAGTAFGLTVLDEAMKEDEEYMPPPRGYEVLEKKKRGGK